MSISANPQFQCNGSNGRNGKTSSLSGHVSGRVGELVADNQDIKIE